MLQRKSEVREVNSDEKERPMVRRYEGLQRGERKWGRMARL